MICATLANVMDGSKDKRKAFEPTDFIPTYDSWIEAEKKKSVDAMNEKLGNAFTALKALANNKKKD